MEGHGRSWKVMEGHGRSWKVMEGHGRSFPDTRLTFQVRKVIGGWTGRWLSVVTTLFCVAFRTVVSDPAPVPVPILRTLDFGHRFVT